VPPLPRPPLFPEVALMMLHFASFGKLACLRFSPPWFSINSLNLLKMPRFPPFKAAACLGSSSPSFTCIFHYLPVRDAPRRAKVARSSTALPRATVRAFFYLVVLFAFFFQLCHFSSAHVELTALPAPPRNVVKMHYSPLFFSPVWF